MIVFLYSQIHLVKVLCYKSKGRWFDPSLCHWNFHWHNPSDRTMALGPTLPITEMNARSISWGKGGRCVRLTTLLPSWAFVTYSGNLNFLEPFGHLRPVTGLLYLFIFYSQIHWPIIYLGRTDSWIKNFAKLHCYVMQYDSSVSCCYLRPLCKSCRQDRMRTAAGVSSATEGRFSAILC